MFPRIFDALHQVFLLLLTYEVNRSLIDEGFDLNFDNHQYPAQLD